MKFIILVLLLVLGTAAADDSSTADYATSEITDETTEPPTVTTSQIVTTQETTATEDTTVTATSTTAVTTRTTATSTAPSTTTKATSTAPSTTTKATSTAPNTTTTVTTTVTTERSTTTTTRPSTNTTPLTNTPLSTSVTTEPYINTTQSVTNTSTEETSTASTETTALPVTTVQPNLEQNFTCQDNGTTKFSLTGTFALSINYKDTKGASRTAYVKVPPAEYFNANCSSAVEILQFEFFNGWSIEYVFDKTGSQVSQSLGADGKYHVSNITVIYIHDEHLPDSADANKTANVTYTSTDYLETSASEYYSCNSNVSLTISEEVTLSTENFKYRAFNDNNNADLYSGSANECSADKDTSSIVPIAVGAALAALVLIVLIAYLIGRKRSRKTGYENV